MVVPIGVVVGDAVDGMVDEVRSLGTGVIAGTGVVVVMCLMSSCGCRCCLHC